MINIKCFVFVENLGLNFSTKTFNSHLNLKSHWPWLPWRLYTIIFSWDLCLSRLPFSCKHFSQLFISFHPSWFINKHCAVFCMHCSGYWLISSLVLWLLYCENQVLLQEYIMKHLSKYIHHILHLWEKTLYTQIN